MSKRQEPGTQRRDSGVSRSHDPSTHREPKFHHSRTTDSSCDVRSQRVHRSVQDDRHATVLWFAPGTSSCVSPKPRMKIALVDTASQTSSPATAAYGTARGPATHPSATAVTQTREPAQSRVGRRGDECVDTAVVHRWLRELRFPAIVLVATPTKTELRRGCRHHHSAWSICRQW